MSKSDEIESALTTNVCRIFMLQVVNQWKLRREKCLVNLAVGPPDNFSVW